MATKSILKNIHITDRKKAAKLVNAMERAERQKPRRVMFGKSVDVVERDEVKLLFADRER